MADNFAFLNETVNDAQHDDESNSTFERSFNNTLQDDYYTFLNLPRDVGTNIK